MSQIEGISIGDRDINNAHLEDQAKVIDVFRSPNELFPVFGLVLEFLLLTNNNFRITHFVF